MTTLFSFVRRPRSLAVFAVLAVAMHAGSVGAQSWTGLGSDGLWSTAGNWSTPPGATAASLNFTGTVTTASFNDAVTSVGTITFGNTTLSGSFVLSGTTPVTVTSAITTANGAAGTDEIAFPINLGSATTIVNVGGNGHFLRLSGIVSNNGATPTGIRKDTDDGRLILTANNVFTGQAEFRIGSVQFPRWGNVSDPAPLGAGNLPIIVGQASATVRPFAELIYDGAGEATNRYIQVGNGASGTRGAKISNNGSGALVFTGTGRPSHPTYGNDLFNQRHPTISAGIDRMLTFSGSSAADNTVESIIVDNIAGSSRIGVTKNGSGRWILAGTNTYTGGTQIEAGTLVLNGLTGTAGFTNNVLSAATLAGSGTLRGPTTVSGIVSPGSGTGSLGTLSFVVGSSGNFIWNSGSTPADVTDWRFDLGPANTSDQVAIAGNFNKSGTGTGFRFDFGGSPQLGTFTLATWTGTTGFSAGDFSAANLGAGNTGTFDILGATLVLTVVPEPTTTLAVVMSTLLGGMLGVRRKGRS
jgi:fibronectin-binding autotransporter adhesin